MTKIQIGQINLIEDLIKKSGLIPVEKKAIQNISDYKSYQLLDVIHFLKSKRKIVELGNNFFIHQDYLIILLNYLKKYFTTSIELSISDFKKISGLTRKTAIPVLEFLDKPPKWEKSMLGLMQLITLSHINQILTKRL